MPLVSQKISANWLMASYCARFSIGDPIATAKTDDLRAFAEAELESIRSLDYSDIATRTTNPTPAAGSPAYQVQTTVVADSPAPSLKSITTQVSWTEPAGSKSVTLYAVYTDVTR